MVKNKYIILPFLFLAWAIIFAHSIFPHHHHSEHTASECNDSHSNIKYLSQTEVHNCDHEGKEYACHFHVEILRRVSIDNIFLVAADYSFYEFLSYLEQNNNNFYENFISTQISNVNHLRGPPVFS